MDTSDWVELGAGLGMGALMSRTIGSALPDAMDAHTSMDVIAVPTTRAEIQTLLDKLDVRLANGEISEATYKTVTEKWEKRLGEIQ